MSTNQITEDQSNAILAAMGYNPTGRRCETCDHFQHEQCTGNLVNVKVHRNGVCDHWATRLGGETIQEVLNPVPYHGHLTGEQEVAQQAIGPIITEEMIKPALVPEPQKGAAGLSYHPTS